MALSKAGITLTRDGNEIDLFYSRQHFGSDYVGCVP